LGTAQIKTAITVALTAKWLWENPPVCSIRAVRIEDFSNLLTQRKYWANDLQLGLHHQLLWAKVIKPVEKENIAMYNHLNFLFRVLS
jgi:hypothetical protein